MMSRPSKEITIVGGGFSGLSLAFFLSQFGFKVKIFERKNWGGMISTKIRPEMQVETAANGFLNSELLNQISQKIDCELKPVTLLGKSRFIYRNGFRRWPIGLMATFVLLKFVWKMIFKKQSILPNEQETIAAWTLRVLNREILDFLVAPAMQGVYAGDVEQMSASLVLSPHFLIAPKRKTSDYPMGTVAPELGMGHFMTQLKKYLETQNVQFIEQEISELSSLPKPLVLAVSAWDAAPLLDPKWNQCKALPVLRATLSFSDPKGRINGFGVLFPPIEKFNSLGALANSNIFSNRGSAYNESWILGGAVSPGLVKLTDDEILQLIKSDRKRMLKIEDEVLSFEIVRWQKGIPHYTLALESLIKSFKNGSNETYLTGNYLGQIGLSKILERNFELASQIKEKYG